MRCFVAAFAVLALLVSALSRAEETTVPTTLPAPLYDEALVPPYTLPELLVAASGEQITTAADWTAKRRPEILALFAEHVYGRTPIARPGAMSWEVTAEDRAARDGTAIVKTVAIYFTAEKADGPQTIVTLTIPKSRTPAPVFLIPAGFGPMPIHEALLEAGYGQVAFDPQLIERDDPAAFSTSVRKFFAPPGQTAPAPDEWAALGAWAWGASRVMDYLETDSDVDARRVAVIGFSRYGKAAMWAAAQDERFAVVISGESGCGGAVLVRRGYGETVGAINTKFPHWFCGNFKRYNDRVAELPVDWHMLVALMAPRPVYIATAEDDRWGDPRGSFLSGVHAEPAYALFGQRGLGVAELPSLETPVGDAIGFHIRRGRHGLTDYDWEQFIAFADRHFGRSKPSR